jgi:hypothetical protein
MLIKKLTLAACCWQGTPLGAEGKFKETWLQVLELIKGMRAPSQLPMQLIGLKDTHLQNADLLLLVAALDGLAVHPESCVEPEVLELQEVRLIYVQRVHSLLKKKFLF